MLELEHWMKDLVQKIRIGRKGAPQVTGHPNHMVALAPEGLDHLTCYKYRILLFWVCQQ